MLLFDREYGFEKNGILAAVSSPVWTVKLPVACRFYLMIVNSIEKTENRVVEKRILNGIFSC